MLRESGIMDKNDSGGPETGGPAFCPSAVLRFLNRIVRQDGIPVLPCPEPGRLLCALMIPLCLRQPGQRVFACGHACDLLPAHYCLGYGSIRLLAPVR